MKNKAEVLFVQTAHETEFFFKRGSNDCPRHEQPTWSYEVKLMAKDKNQKPKPKPKPKK